MASQIEVFRHNSEEGEDLVGMVLVNPCILEYGDGLQPGCTMAAQQARRLAHALISFSDEIETTDKS